jgi:hypothetical protein
MQLTLVTMAISVGTPWWTRQILRMTSFIDWLSYMPFEDNDLRNPIGCLIQDKRYSLGDIVFHMFTCIS